MKEEVFIKKYILNDKIKAKEVRLIGEDGKQAGIFLLADALAYANQRGLELLLVSDSSRPPVCKVIDFGQFKYEQHKKEKLAKKNTKQQVVKEIKMRPKISEHDYLVKVNKAQEFLKNGHRVKVTISFKGREIMHPELGKNLLIRFLESIKDYDGAGSEIANLNRAFIVTINPK